MHGTGWDIVIAGGFASGVALLAISAWMLRRTAREEPTSALPQIGWPQLVDDGLAYEEIDATLRLEMIERLGMLATPWTRGILERARSQESEPQILAAIEHALMSDHAARG